MNRLIAKMIALLVCAMSAFGTGIAFRAADVNELFINPYGGDQESIDTVRWYPADGNYYLFLPSDVDLNTAKVYFSAVGTVFLDGEALESGENAARFTEGAHMLNSGTNSYPLVVCRSANLPAVYIRTESGSLSYLHENKDNREPGNIRVYENGSLTLDKSLKQIKGRGNSTWTDYPKKPYNIKFDKKTDLFGMGKAKKWTLLANYIDLSLLHNACGWEYAEAFGIPYTSEYRMVDLYINGDYLGNYTICESVEIAENRVDLQDLDKANEDTNPGLDIELQPRGGTGPNNTIEPATVSGSRKWIEILETPDDITGGYLLEYEFRSRYDEELSGFVTKDGQPVVVKSPEYASQPEVAYIADLFEAGSEALYSPTGYNAAGKHYSEYFDLDSLAASYILQELSMNFDAGFSSFFAFKPNLDEKIYFGPVWDMDNAFGSPYKHFGVPLITTDLWYANQMGYYGLPSVLVAANRHAEFRALVREKWAAYLSDGTFEAVQEQIAELAEALQKSAVMNGLRWKLYKTRDVSEAENAYQHEVQLCTTFLSDRISALKKGFASDSAYLYYDINGAVGDWVTVNPIRSIGESVEVREITGNGTINPPENRQFYCWNTAPDDSGTRYFPGDTLLLKNESTVLYAIWKTQFEIDRENGVNPFTDVAEDVFYHDPVLWAYYNEPQVTSGTSASCFSPNMICTREQVVTFLWAACGKPKPQTTVSPFQDVKKGAWYYNAVLWAMENGITSGVSSERFGVRQPCTREQAVTFLWASQNKPKAQTITSPFTDVNQGDWFYHAVLWAAENRITVGIGNDLFGVGQSCTRAQIITFLFSCFGRSS